MTSTPQVHYRFSYPGNLRNTEVSLSEHIPLHKLWIFASLGSPLDRQASEHIMSCDDCFQALKVCLKAETFGDALETLGRDDDGYRYQAYF